MTILFKNIIHNFKFTKQELVTISDICSLSLTAREKWAHPDFLPIYSRLKNYFLIYQNKTCYFCQKKLVTITNEDWHIDHIVSVDEDDRHVFTAENWILVCKWCNRDKNSKKILKNRPKSKAYSKSSANYKIIHPRYDDYSIHIDILSEMIYTSLTPKGKETKSACNLERFQLKYLSNLNSTDRDYIEGALKFLLSNNPRSLSAFLKSLQ